MQPIIPSDDPRESQQASPVLAIARDLQRLAADLDRICQGDDAILSVALEDAHYALTRAVIAVREVLVATAAAGRSSATVAQP